MEKYDSDFLLLKFNLQRFLKLCEQAQKQTTTAGLRLKDVQGTFRGFELKVSFGSGNLVKRPGLAFLKDGNQVSKGIYPILVFIPEFNELILCKGVSYDNPPEMEWIINEKDIPFSLTKYSDEKGKYNYFINAYSVNDFNEDMIKDIQLDLERIIEDYPI